MIQRMRVVHYRRPRRYATSTRWVISGREGLRSKAKEKAVFEEKGVGGGFGCESVGCIRIEYESLVS